MFKKSLLAPALVALLTSSMTSFALSQDKVSLSKAVYSQMEEDRLLKIVGNLIKDKKLAEANKILTVLEQSRSENILYEVAKIRYRRLDSLQRVKTAIRILTRLVTGKSALKGKAAFELARLYRTNPTLQMQHQLLETLLLAAEAGYTKAYAEIGVLYTSGVGVSKNTHAALQYYKLAAKFESVAPIISFARFLHRSPNENDCGINPSDLVAKYYPQLVAEATKGYRGAAKELARLHYEGTLKPRSIEKARTWLRQAVIHGDIGALRDLALLELRTGDGQGNLNRSLSMLKDAAAAGNSAALTALGRLEKKLQITIPDDRLGTIKGSYFEKAATAGDRRAIIEMAHTLSNPPHNLQAQPGFGAIAQLARNQGVDLTKLNIRPQHSDLLKPVTEIAGLIDPQTTGSVGTTKHASTAACLIPQHIHTGTLLIK